MKKQSKSNNPGIKFSLALKKFDQDSEFVTSKPWFNSYTKFLIIKEDLKQSVDEDFEKMKESFSTFY